MIVRQVEEMNIEGFLEVINNQKFTLPEFDQFIIDFCAYLESSSRERTIEEINKKLRISKQFQEKEFEKRFFDVMDEVDLRILERQEYMEKVEVKNKYRGRYANYKGKTSNTKR